MTAKTNTTPAEEVVLKQDVLGRVKTPKTRWEQLLDEFERSGLPGPDAPWEPAWDDTIFLAKLEKSLAAFAARYDGKPWRRSAKRKVTIEWQRSRWCPPRS